MPRRRKSQLVKRDQQDLVAALPVLILRNRQNLWQKPWAEPGGVWNIKIPGFQKIFIRNLQTQRQKFLIEAPKAPKVRRVEIPTLLKEYSWYNMGTIEAGSVITDPDAYEMFASEVQRKARELFGEEAKVLHWTESIELEDSRILVIEVPKKTFLDLDKRELLYGFAGEQEKRLRIEVSIFITYPRENE